MKNLIIAADGETMPAGAPIKEVFGVAYSGAEFTQPWEELPIVLDLAGLEIAPQVPLLYDHDNEPRMRLGVVEAAVEDNRLVIAGEIAATGEHGREVIEGGRLWPWQLSIGARVLASEVIEEPRTVNGREVANCLLITRAQLREVSVVAVGADKETHLDSAAAFGGKPPKKEEKTMEKEEKNTLDANADEKSAARVDGIAAALADHPETCAEAIRAGWSVAQAQSVAAALKKAESNVPPAVANINAGAEAESARRVLRGALELRAGIAPERTGLTDRELEAADKQRSLSLRDFLGEAMRLEGRPVANLRSRADIEAAFSTAAIPALLSDVANKRVKQEFEAAAPRAPRLCTASDLNDYKKTSVVNLLVAGELPVLHDGQEIPNGKLTESAGENRVRSHAMIITVGHEAIVNDDLGELLKIPQLMGRNAAAQLDRDFFAGLVANPAMGDGQNLFSAAHKNQLTGATSALSVAALNKARALLLKQTDAAGNPLNLRPRYLVVPPELYGLAEQIAYGDTLTVSTAQDAPAGTYNPIRGWDLQVVAAAELSDAKAWYLLTDPARGATFDIAYLRGQQTPIVERDSAPFNYRGLAFRCFFDYGIAALDFRGAIYAAGQ